MNASPTEKLQFVGSASVAKVKLKTQAVVLKYPSAIQSIFFCSQLTDEISYYYILKGPLFL